MKRYIRNILLILMWGLGVGHLAQRHRNNTPLLRILTFHDIPDRWAESFDRTIAWLVDQYNIVSPNDIRTGTLNRHKINVLLTFDDGFESWTRNVLPVLDRYQITGLFFVSSGFIDTAGNVEAEREFCNLNLKISHKSPLTWDMVRSIADNHEIGGHTTNHQSLAHCSRQQMIFEVRRDRERIASHIGREPRIFAYPFGRKRDISETSMDVIQKSGYVYAMTTQSAFADIQNSLLSIARTNIDPIENRFVLSAIVEGTYDILSQT